MAFDPWSYNKNKDCYIDVNEAKNPACGVEVAGWKLLDTVTVTLAPLGGEVAGWKLLDTVTVTLAPLGGEVAGWKLLDTMRVTLAPPEISCSVDADCSEGYVCRDGKCVKKTAFPWQWLAIGGAFITGVILLIPRPKKAVKKK